MKKVFKIAILCISLVIGNLVFQADAGAKADIGTDQIIRPMFTNVNAFVNGFCIFDDGEASVDSYLSFRDADYATINMYLDQYVNGSWTRVKSWTTTGYGWYASDARLWYVMSGYQYRMRAYGYVYASGSMVESVSYTSEPWYY